MEVISRGEAKALGLKRYFTGEPCKHGHVTHRSTNDQTCAECGRVKQAKYAAKNPNKQRERLASWRAKNADREREYKLRYKSENAERVRENRLRYYRENSDKERLKSTKGVRDVSPNYVASKLKLPLRMLPPELYDLKKKQIEFHRLQAELNVELKEISK